MSYNGVSTDWTLPAAADLSAKQYYLVTNNASGKAALATAGQKVFGSLQNKPDAADKAAAIQIAGIAKCIAGAAVAINAEVASDANGKLRLAQLDDEIFGRAMVAAAAAGDIIPVLIGSEGRMSDYHVGLLAAADYTAGQYLAVDLKSDGKAELSGDGEQVLGSLYNAPDADEVCIIKIAGMTTFTANAATTLGGNVGSGANGKLNDAATGDAIVGITFEAATGDTDTFPVLITNAGESA